VPINCTYISVLHNTYNVLSSLYSSFSTNYFVTKLTIDFDPLFNKHKHISINSLDIELGIVKSNIYIIFLKNKCFEGI
jgi:hypothetical protein